MRKDPLSLTKSVVRVIYDGLSPETSERNFSGLASSIIRLRGCRSFMDIKTFKIGEGHIFVVVHESAWKQETVMLCLR